ncbi:hypothetical protein HK096_006387, partial [Nowakowskiella sp. JEL0078]
YLSYPVISFQAVCDMYANSILVEGPRPLLDRFIFKIIPVLDLLPRIPSLIHFYKHLNFLFGYRLTKEQARQPVLDCLKSISHLESHSVISDFETTWRQFKVTWDIVKRILGKLPGCHIQQEQAAFELHIIEVNDSTPLIELITEDTESTNALIRVIDALRGEQEILLAVENSENFEDLDNEYSSLLLFGTQRSKLKLQAAWLADDPSLLLGGDFTKIDWEEFILSQVRPVRRECKILDEIRRLDLTVDWKNIERKVIHYFVIILYCVNL